MEGGRGGAPPDPHIQFHIGRGQATEYEQHPDLLSDSVRDYLAFGEQVSAERYIRAQNQRERIHAAYAEFFAGHGVAALFTPTVGCVAFDNTLAYPPKIGGVEIDDVWRDWAPMLYDANLAGLPACTVPIGTGAGSGLPVGGQLLGPRLSDRRLLRAAATLTHALSLPTAAF